MKTVTYTDLPSLVGEVFGVSDWLEVTQDRVNTFAEATGDFQWIHVDVARATREIGGPIAHGDLIVSLIPLLRASIFEVHGQAWILNYGADRVRFIHPVKAGKRIRMRSRLLRAKQKSGGIQAVFEHGIELERETKPACVAETISLYLPGKAQFFECRGLTAPSTHQEPNCDDRSAPTRRR